MPGTPDPDETVTPVEPVDALTPVTPMERIDPMDTMVVPVLRDTPVMAVEHDETTEPRDMPLEVLPPPEPQVRFARSSSAPENRAAFETRAPVLTPTAELPRAFQPSPFSGTALVRRPDQRWRIQAWWLAVVAFVIALIVAIVR
jgi:hypothetical protein